MVNLTGHLARVFLTRRESVIVRNGRLPFMGTTPRGSGGEA